MAELGFAQPRSVSVRFMPVMKAIFGVGVFISKLLIAQCVLQS
jgi:hypothetical protein